MKSRKGIAGMVEELCQELLPEMGIQLVDVEYGKETDRFVLRVIVYKTSGITLDDCETVSVLLGNKLDEKDTIPVSYNLEVSSPGIYRRLKHDKEYELFKGQMIQISTFTPVNGKKRHIGRLLGLYDENVKVRTEDDSIIQIPKANIAIAKLAGTRG